MRLSLAIPAFQRYECALHGYITQSTMRLYLQCVRTQCVQCVCTWTQSMDQSMDCDSPFRSKVAGTVSCRTSIAACHHHHMIAPPLCSRISTPALVKPTCLWMLNLCSKWVSIPSENVCSTLVLVPPRVLQPERTQDAAGQKGQCSLAGWSALHADCCLWHACTVSRAAPLCAGSTPTHG